MFLIFCPKRLRLINGVGFSGVFDFESPSCPGGNRGGAPLGRDQLQGLALELVYILVYIGLYWFLLVYKIYWLIYVGLYRFMRTPC